MSKKVNILKIDSMYQLTKLVESLVLSGYTLNIKPIYKNELCIGGPHIAYFEVSYEEKD